VLRAPLQANPSAMARAELDRAGFSDVSATPKLSTDNWQLATDNCFPVVLP